MAAEFERQDVDATMATMVDDPHLNHVPTMTGGVGFEELIARASRPPSGE